MLIEQRVDRRIRAAEVRVIGPGGEQVGVLPLAEALARARELGLNLIEVSPGARPPVCKIADHGKLKYEAKRRKPPRPKVVKEVQLRPRIAAHDLEMKRERLRAFLLDGASVRVTLVFRGREPAHFQAGLKLLLGFIESVSACGAPEQLPKREGRQLVVMLRPRAKVT